MFLETSNLCPRPVPHFAQAISDSHRCADALESAVPKSLTPDITQEQVKSLLHYDMETGVFTRMVRTSNRIKVGDIAGSINVDGYLLIMLHGIRHQAHRLAWLYVYGVWPTNDIDHADGNKTNNRISNLRDSTNSENHQNRRMAKGYSFCKAAGKWMATIKVDGKCHYLGVFSAESEARAAYLAAKKIYHPTSPINTQKEDLIA